MRTLLTVADRTAVLFLGVAAGVAIGYAFGASRTAPVPPAIAVATPGTAPPPPSTGTGTSAAPAPQVASNGRPAPPAAPVPLPEQSATTFPPHLIRSIAEGRKVRVGVFGDSYGDGIWSALYHLLSAKDGYEVAKFSQQSTGFTRYASLNLEEHAREQLSGNPVDVAVISFGANDTQGVLSGRHAAALLSPEWQEIIGRRVDGFVAELRAQGATVYWVGLPKMRKPEFDADIAGMNAFYERKMRELGVPWIETASMTVDENGQFSPYLADGPDGERKLMRANDGIHMSYAGYVRITRGLVARINAYVAAARRMAAASAPPPRPADAAPAPASGAAS
ncbi:GDSL-type esterase/lipase family protein [Sphingomonas profundi]|uniref:SGNH/GDSL hydrolase family protein n=1 Tax=Alterirhizorhabdus profundi TaxID=2681549 RepID=UPI0012E82343|nr:GDSL-type esterase/lipase family protein [Sphingomonas profundi]